MRKNKRATNLTLDELNELERASRLNTASVSDNEFERELELAESKQWLVIFKTTEQLSKLKQTLDLNFARSDFPAYFSNTLKAKLNEKLSRAVRDSQDGTGMNMFFSNIPLLSMAMTADAASSTARSFKQLAIDETEKQASKLLQKANKTFEERKQTIKKQVAELIELKDSETSFLQNRINTLETLSREALAKNKELKKKSEKEVKDLRGQMENLQHKSDEEIGKLQESLKDLNKKLAEYEKKKREADQHFKNFFNKDNWEEPAVNEMESHEDKIERLEKRIAELQEAGTYLSNSLDLEKMEVKRLKKELEREKTFLNNEIKRKESEIKSKEELLELEKTQRQNELARERKIFLDEQARLNQEIRSLETARQKARDDRDEAETRLNNELTKNLELESRKSELKLQLSTLQTQYDQLKAEHEPSFLYQIGEYTGINWIGRKIGATLTLLGAFTVLGILTLIFLIFKLGLLPLFYHFFKRKVQRKITELSDSEVEEPEVEVIEIKPKRLANLRTKKKLSQKK